MHGQANLSERRIFRLKKFRADHSCKTVCAKYFFLYDLQFTFICEQTVVFIKSLFQYNFALKIVCYFV